MNTPVGGDVPEQAAMRVGITGHRDLGNHPVVGWHVHAACVRVLDRLLDLARTRGTGLEAYSALAIGADQIFAQAALGLGIPLIGGIPFEEYPNDFQGADRQSFDFLVAQCQRVHRLPHQNRSNQAYFDVGKWLVDEVEYVVAVWNGKPAAGLGGTANIVEYAERNQRTIFRIDPTKLVWLAKP